ncbi:hypothetical protein [Aquabacterium sp. OR-4]|uniref:hypothetical protein n=1 Tax=Aquabacterium sp. OR-4 TaxID=2978127 RepID=UPI0028C661F9|nr:hypothetical protein [Aquabacterium sp. OR-4]MDT7835071.1 hypothetical protein [Aquabacterium sp. OR-4]
MLRTASLPYPERYPERPLTELPPALKDHVRSLGRHLQQCRQAQGRLFGLNRLATDMHGWVAPRFVTTLAVAAVLIALASS